MVAKKTSDTTIGSMEDPISAVFHLADESRDKLRSIMSFFRIAISIVLVYTVFDILSWISVSFDEGDISYLACSLIPLTSGVLLLIVFSRLRKHSDYFNRRYAAISSIQHSDPFVPIPQGNTLLERYINYLWYISPKLQHLMMIKPKALQIKSSFNRADDYFDAIIQKKPGLSWRLFGFGNRGYGFYIKTFNHIPTLEELRVLEWSGLEVSRRYSIPPSRIVALFQIGGNDMGLSDEAYDYLIKHKITCKMRFREFTCTMQAVIEMQDNSYDFIPIIFNFPDRLP